MKEKGFKETGFIIDVVVGAEYERMTIIDPHSRRVAFEGNTTDALAFLESAITNFKNSSEHESK